ncbi:hypothetical protein [Pseudomonas protegens]|uniref:hypothetical protein n=1 Tax=Pseudomonas protegens TaxID=380021 RepID=UPI00283A9ECB|nr:hypothetical protein [Pseudomonas protegens]
MKEEGHSGAMSLKGFFQVQALIDDGAHAVETGVQQGQDQGRHIGGFQAVAAAPELQMASMPSPATSSEYTETSTVIDW